MNIQVRENERSEKKDERSEREINCWNLERVYFRLIGIFWKVCS